MSRQQFLQTAQSIIFNNVNRKSKNARVLFENGTQKSFINKKLSEALGLLRVRKKRKLLKGFESKNEVFRELDIVQAKLKDIHGENPTLLELIVVPTICSPLSNQTIELTQATHSHLVTLPLSGNTGGNSELEANVLIGGSYYWSFFTGKIVRGETGPVAIVTLLGWVLSGNTGMTVSSQYVITHVLKVSCIGEVSESARDNCLIDSTKQCWQIEEASEMGVTDNDLFDQFSKSIRYKNKHYAVKLPWKQENNTLPDNYQPSLQGLKSVYRKLSKDTNLLRQYDEIIQI